MNGKTRIYARKEPWAFGVGIYVERTSRVDEARSKRSFATAIQLTEFDEGTEPPAALSLDMNAAQALMDDLWNAGLRPTEGAGSAGAMAATQKHLEDMRKLVFEGGKA